MSIHMDVHTLVHALKINSGSCLVWELVPYFPCIHLCRYTSMYSVICHHTLCIQSHITLFISLDTILLLAAARKQYTAISLSNMKSISLIGEPNHTGGNSLVPDISMHKQGNKSNSFSFQ